MLDRHQSHRRGARVVRLRAIPGALVAALAASSVALLPATSAAAQVPAIVEIRVTNESDGSPLAGASVRVPSAGLDVTAEATGVAALRGLAPGVHRIRVSALGFAGVEVEVEAINGRTVERTVSLAPDPLAVAGLDVNGRPADAALDAVVVLVDSLGPGVSDLPDALDRVPGVTVVRYGGPGSESTIQIRGSGADQVLVLLDGVPIGSALTGESDLSSVDLASLDRIVVLPGARSARYGPRALGGVVLLESRERTRTSGAASLGVGSWGSGALSADVTWSPRDRVSLSAGAQWRRSEGDFVYDVPAFRGGGQAQRDNAGFHTVGGHLQLGISGPALRASLRLHGNRLERGSPGPVAQPSLTGEQHHRRHGASLRGEAGQAVMGLAFTGLLKSQRAEYRDSTPPFGPSYDQETDASLVEVDLDAWKALGPWLLRSGSQLRRTEVRSTALDAPTTRIGEVGIWSRAELAVPLGSETTADLHAGLRLDRHDLVEEVAVSPSLVAALQRSGTRLEVALRNGFSPPGLADLFFQEGVLVQPNPALRPERVRGEVSLSVEQRLAIGAVRVDGRGSAYRADVHDMILWFPDFRFVWSPENFDVARRGLELGTRVAFPVAGRTHSVSAQLEWSRVEYRGDVLSGQVAYRPVITGDARAAFDLGKADLSVRVSHVGPRRSVPGSDLNALDPYTVVDLGLGVPLPLARWDGRLDLALTNLLDAGAAMLVDYPLPGRGWSVRLRLTPHPSDPSAPSLRER